MLDKNDHRSIGQKLELFHFQDEAPGMVFWHPRGWRLYRLLQERIRSQLERDGYQEVCSPQVLGQSLWEGSGHWLHFREAMMVLPGGALKPVSCPGHIQVFREQALSFRDLPLRLAEFGLCHRNELSGALQGLFRLRQFTQDDGHVFCAEEQVVSEVAGFVRSLRSFYRQWGFDDFGVAFSGRPARRAGADAVWDRAEALLWEAAEASGLSWQSQPGEGAFYGPKLEFSLKDRLGRAWQCGTIQVDLVMPERLGAFYVDSGGARRRPVLLHRAWLGSLERFLGILLEHHQGALPAWLCPEQVVVIPVGADDVFQAQEAASQFRAENIRVAVDVRDVPLSKRVRDAHERGIPFVAVVGPKERAAGEVNLRGGATGHRHLPSDAARLVVRDACAPPAQS